jgi:hypothetical protein
VGCNESFPLPTAQCQHPRLPFRSARCPSAMAGRRYLSLLPLRLEELPHHPDLFPVPSPSSPDLSAFLRAIFTEACAEDFESGVSTLGKWSPDQGRVAIPALAGEEADVPVVVEQRKKTNGKEAWFGRRSTHNESDVKYAELNRLLTTDHSWYEYLYTPDLYDGNMLLEWDSTALEEAANKFKADLAISDIEMRSELCCVNRYREPALTFSSPPNVPYSARSFARPCIPCSGDIGQAIYPIPHTTNPRGLCFTVWSTTDRLEEPHRCTGK